MLLIPGFLSGNPFGLSPTDWLKVKIGEALAAANENSPPAPISSNMQNPEADEDLASGEHDRQPDDIGDMDILPVADSSDRRETSQEAPPKTKCVDSSKCASFLLTVYQGCQEGQTREKGSCQKVCHSH